MNKKLVASLLLILFLFYVFSHVVQFRITRTVRYDLVPAKIDPLREAICDDVSVQEVEIILKSFKDPFRELNNWKYSGYLSEAIKKKRIDILQLLLEYGADPNGDNLDVSRDIERHALRQPLIAAIRHDQKAVEILLSYGASATIEQNGYPTPIESAIKNNASREIRELLYKQSHYAQCLTRHFEEFYNMPEADRVSVVVHP